MQKYRKDVVENEREEIKQRTLNEIKNFKAENEIEKMFKRKRI